MCLRKNNKGMTLIELIISMAISAIVLSMIIIIINSASHGFRRTSDEVNLQLEAQTTLNLLSNLSMEASEIKESENKPSLLDKKYVIEGNARGYTVLFIKSEKELYLIEADTTLEAESIPYSEDQEFKAKYLMAEYVEALNISGLGTNNVTIELSFALGNDTDTISKKVKLRNAN